MSDWQDDTHTTYRPLLDNEATEDYIEARDRLRKARRQRLLLLDDTGKEYGGSDKKHIETAFENLLRSRYDDTNPTFLTTNVPLMSWAKIYGESLFSFVHEAFEIIGLGRQDWRRGEG